MSFLPAFLHFKSKHKHQKLNNERLSGKSLSKQLGSADKPNSTPINWGFVRIRLSMLIFALIWGILWIRAGYLQLIDSEYLADKAQRQHIATELVGGRRGAILDRNGQVLARSIEALSVYAHPRDIKDPKVTAETLAPILNIDSSKLVEILSNQQRSFVWLKRKVDDSTALAVRKTALYGIGLSKEYDRIYPFKHMAGQLLGFVGIDDKGLEGLERSLEPRLASPPSRRMFQRDAMGRRFFLDDDDDRNLPQGQNIALTIDVQLQFMAEEAIATVAKEYDARWAGALLVDVPSGEILAWAQYPFFNPNLYRESNPNIYRNRLAADALEPGSTFKPLVIAAALQEGKIEPSTLIDCENGLWETKSFVLRDTSVRGIISVDKVLRYSSNIGMAKIGLDLGPRAFRSYMSRLGFGERTSVPVAESRGILRPLRKWGEVNTMASAFGQSISVTCLQMTQAYLTLLNHGVYKPLKLLKENDNTRNNGYRVFRDDVSRKVMLMMRDVVESNDGTGRRARIDGVEVGGKTGTAQKADAKTGEYGSKRSASFVGFLPADKPRYLVFIMVDEPTLNQYGGVVAAAAFKEIASNAMTWSGHLALSDLSSNPKNKLPTSKKRQRGLKLARQTAPWLNQKNPLLEASKPNTMRLPGHLTKASDKIPDVQGKTVRNAVELFARAGVVPELKGQGSHVIKQSPAPGSNWSENKEQPYILWLSEK